MISIYMTYVVKFSWEESFIMHWTLFRVISDLKHTPGCILNNIVPLPFYSENI